jgi:hypothetical protein
MKLALATGPLACLTLLASSPLACGSHSNAGYALDVGGDDGGNGDFVHGETAGQGLDAHIEEGQVAVKLITLSCVGSCATVEAVGTGGHPPYTYRWEDGSTDPVRQVCPAADSSYSVNVTDTGVTGEVPTAAQTAHASVIAEVLTCPDASAPLPEGDACSDAIQNPSFEGTPQTTNITPWDAPAWQKCGGSPAEITGASSSPEGPFVMSAILAPSDGQTDLWIQPSAGVLFPGPGGAGQALCSPIPSGGSLSFRIDAQMVPVSDAGPPTQNFEIYGGNTACCDAAGCGSAASPLLFTSPALTTGWATYCVTLAPSQSTGSLTFTSAGVATNATAHVVLDHIVPVTSCP